MTKFFEIIKLSSKPLTKIHPYFAKFYKNHKIKFIKKENNEKLILCSFFK